MNDLSSQIIPLVDLSVCAPEVAERWHQRLPQGNLTRDEDDTTHFCCYFLPYNPITQQVFIVHHKKSGLWLFPGGHIDRGETLMQALNREIEEELGVANKIEVEIKPFLLTITLIENRIQPCKEHLDLWYRFYTDGSEFKVNPKEFHNTKWVSIQEARDFIRDPANLEALTKMEELFSASSSVKNRSNFL